uniref:Skp1-related protein n=1 Tax=Caenorhabditis tropicalis TaxID=1561998 RepID=A0A1I7T4S5_9PELO
MSSEETSSNETMTVIVISSDGKEFELDIKLTEQSETLSRLIENFDYSNSEVKKLPIPLKNINTTQMEKIILWLNHYKDHDPFVPRDKNYVPNYSFGVWANNFLNIPNNELYELVTAANYLSIPRLYDAVGRKIASKIAGKDAEQIRQAFNLTGDSGCSKKEERKDECS